MTKILRWMLLCLIGVLSLEQVATADPPEPETEWGDFSGQLIYDGEPPVREPFIPKQGKPAIRDESLVVDPKTRGIANVFVYLQTERNPDQSLTVHPSYQEQIKKPVSWHVSPTGYSPHVMLLHTGQKIIVKNVGGVISNSKGFVDPSFGVLIPPGSPQVYQFTKAERLPNLIGCNIHAWFSACLLVRDNPYMAVTDHDGKFTIKNLPTGEHEIQFWQETSGYLPLPAVNLRDAELKGDHKKGRLQLLIQSGENDLGVIRIDPQVFE